MPEANWNPNRQLFDEVCACVSLTESTHCSHQLHS